jgi:hypothetical protein
MKKKIENKLGVGAAKSMKYWDITQSRCVKDLIVSAQIDNLHNSNINSN